jgi:hypothetical protein
MEYDSYTDKEIIDAIIKNNRAVIEYFFCKKCSKLLSYIAYAIFDSQVDCKELLSEFFLYIAQNDWYKLKQFDYRSSLHTWISVVASRFFQKKRDTLVEKGSSEALISQNKEICTPIYKLDYKMDLYRALDKMGNERYRKVIYALDLEDREPEDVATELNVSIDYLYNLHHRAILNLKSLMGRKEEYL